MAASLLTKLPQLFGRLGKSHAGQTAVDLGRQAGGAGAWLGWGGRKGREMLGPAWAFPGMYLGGSFVAGEIASPLAQGAWYSQANPLNRLTGDSPNQIALANMQKQRTMDAQMYLSQIERQMKKQQLERSTAQNAARLAATAPHLYNQILAGRQLPQGAVVLGGQPRTDLLEQLSYGMAMGQTQESPMGTQEEFLSTLGV